MKTRAAALLGFLFLALTASAAGSLTLTLTRTGDAARPNAVAVVLWTQLAEHDDTLRVFHFVVRDAESGQVVPSQLTNYEHDHRGFAPDDLVVFCDFAAGERMARLIVEKADEPVPPESARVMARYVPERYDDFAWESDRIAYRMYGPALDSPAAGDSRLRSSGIDVWAKRVPWLVVDRWYLKGHDQFHVDDGEGLDLYSVGSSRGCGGVGVWDGATLHTSGNFTAWRVLANGPRRAVFELRYASWQAGDLTVSEVKRVTLDAGENLNRIESTFIIEGGDGTAVIAIGLAKPNKATLVGIERDEAGAAMRLWQSHGGEGNLGCAVVLGPDHAQEGFAEDARNFLLLTRVRSGETLRYLAGAGWDRSGQFADAAAWAAHVADRAGRLRDPIRVTVSAE